MKSTRLFLATLAFALLTLGTFSDFASADDHKKGHKKGQEAGLWISLFDGKTLGDWKANESKDAFSVVEGSIVVNGPRGHLFYMGKDHEFKNFHFRAEVKTKPNSNSGIYFHTQWQDEGWPEHGYESQVNVSQGDPVKSGSLYNTVKIFAEDIEKAGLSNESWWVQEILVRGKHIVVKLNGNVVVDYTEPDDKEGTVTYFRNLEVRRLPDGE